MIIKVTTTDSAWIARNGFAVDADGDALVPVTGNVERLTFAGVPMVRFDMQEVTRKMPRGWANRWSMLPATRVVEA